MPAKRFGPSFAKSGLILAAALIVRWLYVLVLLPPTHWADTLKFLQHAESLLRGDGYGVPDRPPAFPFALAGLLLFDDYPTSALVFQVWLSALIPVLVFWLARSLYPDRVPEAAGGFAVFYFPLVDIARLIGSDTLFIFLLTLSAVLLTRAASLKAVFLGGLVYGLSCLTRGVGLAIWPFAALLGLTGLGPRTIRHSRYATVAALTAGMLLPILPWAFRNWRAYSAFVPISSEAGFNFFQGTQPGYRERQAWDFKLASSLTGGQADDYDDLLRPEFQSRLMKYWLEMWVRDPALMLRLRWLYFWDFWSPVEPLRLYTPGVSMLYGRLAYSLVLLFCLPGLAEIVRRRTAGAYFVLASIIGIMTLHVLSHAEQNRYRLPLEPMLIALAANGAGLSLSLARGWFHARRVRSPSEKSLSGLNTPKE